MNPRQQLEVDLRRWLRHHHSIIGHTEALHVGATDVMIYAKVARGEWDRLHYRVYRDAAAPRTPYQDLRAACVATEGFGVVSHASAAWVWSLIDRPPTIPELTVREGTRHYHPHPGMIVHRSSDLVVAEAVERNSILVTNPLRTLVDLAGAAHPRQLTEAVDNALARQLVTVAGLEAEIERRSQRGRTGVGALRRHLLEQGYAGAPQPSVLEAHMHRLIKRTCLPLPIFELQVNEVGNYRLDVAWSAILFAVEVDGYMWHFSPAHKERDETRRNDLQRAGWTLLIYTWRKVLNEPGRVSNEIVATYRTLCPSA